VRKPKAIKAWGIASEGVPCAYYEGLCRWRSIAKNRWPGQKLVRVEIRPLSPRRARRKKRAAKGAGR
jgi:hypothetical protein